jgi:hypothetical protein
VTDVSSEPPGLANIMGFMATWKEVTDAFIVEPPEHLYHYTDVAGLHGILRSNELWATNAVFVNDSTELLHSLLLLKRIIESPTPDDVDAGIPNADADAIMMHVLANLAEFFDVFIVCFCTSRDLLSQWRCYGTDGAYSLGFDTAGLIEAAGGLPLQPVIYDEAEHLARLRELCRLWREAYVGMPSREEDVRSFNIGLLTFAEALSRIIVTFKNPTFQEEREWRFVHRSLKILDDPGMDVHFRYRNGMLMSYVVAKIALTVEERALMPISSITVGPARYPPNAGYGVVEFLRALGYPSSREMVKHSSATLRV